MPNPYFRFKQFVIYQDRCAMKVTTDACLFGAWVVSHMPEAAETVLDVGAGTGLLALMIAQAGSRLIDAIEIQEADHEQAGENIAQSGFHAGVRLIQGNVLEYAFDRTYDVIVSNPPFYEGDLKGGQLNKNIAHHSDALSLPELLSFIRKQLDADGRFFLLLPVKRAQELFGRLEISGLFINHCCYVHQTEKHPAFRIMVEGALRKRSFREERIVIRKENEYTPEFKALLQPYYLHL
ncbi:tRNA1(Val) (adenine(37)-N6)-methyltransferase [Niabella drilacis]|uniref:tRNA1Val (Adenine37-N6)-methyltransferase n=1 Tax=Niabella drilacis (strain DSM 25811 / CCM 8410 / CCUG 62505 / LMG 26954 / E90) TaxID=1285928 RepID=A0A1G6LA66_NIADE|nr:methyltransferase [Niabella drilacis]SDC40058.1 tRNA1Val (adenine37-N6)-methyltransferase [Niabella drilacis]